MACTIANGCCTRHPTVCSRMHAADSVQRHTHHLPTAAARRPRFAGVTSNSTYGLELPFSNTSTYWSAPVPDVPPYRKLVSRILAPFAQDGISHSRVWQSTQARTTCAVLRVSGRSVCKVSRVAQKSERSHHAPQERGLFALVREISARYGDLPDFEIAYCPGDGESVVAEPAAARRRWNGRSGCAPAPVYATASLVQFRCQAKGHLPFMMWYRENVFGNWSGWDAKAAALRAEAVKVPWDSRKKRAFFRGTIDSSREAMDEAGCLAAGRERRPARCQALHVARAHPERVDYTTRGPPTRGFAGWAAYRYVLFLEGTEEWADRLKLLLQLGSVVLMQELWCNEHYAWMLTPWVHYVPVATDLSDLAEVVAFLQEHDELARRIGAEAQAFARLHLSRDSLLAYHHQLLLGYAAIYRPDHRAAARAAPRCPATDAVVPNRGLESFPGPRVTLCRRPPR